MDAQGAQEPTGQSTPYSRLQSSSPVLFQASYEYVDPRSICTTNQRPCSPSTPSIPASPNPFSQFMFEFDLLSSPDLTTPRDTFSSYPNDELYTDEMLPLISKVEERRFAVQMMKRRTILQARRKQRMEEVDSRRLAKLRKPKTGLQYRGQFCELCFAAFSGTRSNHCSSNAHMARVTYYFPVEELEDELSSAELSCLELYLKLSDVHREVIKFWRERPADTVREAERQKELAKLASERIQRAKDVQKSEQAVLRHEYRDQMRGRDAEEASQTNSTASNILSKRVAKLATVGFQPTSTASGKDRAVASPMTYANETLALSGNAMSSMSANMNAEHQRDAKDSTNHCSTTPKFQSDRPTGSGKHGRRGQDTQGDLPALPKRKRGRPTNRERLERQLREAADRSEAPQALPTLRFGHISALPDSPMSFNSSDKENHEPSIMSHSSKQAQGDALKAESHTEGHSEWNQHAMKMPEERPDVDMNSDEEDGVWENRRFSSYTTVTNRGCSFQETVMDPNNRADLAYSFDNRTMEFGPFL